MKFLFLTFILGIISMCEGDLPFITLGSTTDVSTTNLSTSDIPTASGEQISPGFPFGNSTQKVVFTSRHGYFSFGRRVSIAPLSFPGSRDVDYIVAPFSANLSASGGTGTGLYEVHTISSSPALLSEVSSFIRQQKNTRFAGTWMLVAEWRNVRQPGGMINIFQGILITNGFQSYTVFTYQCGQLQWSGDVVIGFQADNELYVHHPMSNTTSIACQNSPNSIWSNLIYQLHLKEIRFLPLGLNRIYLPSMDDGISTSIPIVGGFPLGTSMQTSVYVSTNGILSFGRTFPYHTPHPFPGTSFYNFLIAPFWADSDISSGVGNVSYELHENETDAMVWVNTFISQQQQINFTGSWMLVAEWRNVPAYQGQQTETNTFQAVLITDGFQSYAVFTYKCGLMQWAGGAGIGFNTDSRLYKNHHLSSAANANIIACHNSPTSNWTNVIYILRGPYLPFLGLGNTSGVNQVFLPRDLGGASNGISIPGGLPFGSINKTPVYVVSNGFFSFGRRVNFFNPVLFPESTSYSYLVALFWADHDPRPSGQISYEVHASNTPVMSEVSTFVSLQQNINFVGTWMLLAEWNSVPEYGSDTKLNTYQGIVVTDGDQSYVVFTYQCGAMTWHGNATIGFNAGGTLFQNHHLSGTTAASDIACLNYSTTVWTNLIYRLTPSVTPYLLYTQYTSLIRRVNLDGNQLSTVYSSGYPHGLDFDFSNNLMFWTDINSDRIWRAQLDNSNPTTLVSTGMQCAGGLAWDWVNKKLYWTDYCADDIEVYDPSTGYRRVLITTGSSSNPRGIVVDPRNRWMYWTDHGSVPKIEKASMDGTSRTAIHTTTLTTPYGLTLDYDTQTLYWTDYSLNRIEKSSVDGSNRVLVTTTNVLDPYFITYYDGVLYWGDWSYNRLLMTSISSPNTVTFLTTSASDQYGIQVIAKERQREATNPCEANNGNCSHLCLLSSISAEGYRCACPDNQVLTANQKECKPPPYLLFSRYYGSYDQIYRMKVDGTQPTLLYSGGRIRALTIDYRREYIFWTDISSDRLYRSRLDGSQRTTLISSGLPFAEGLAWDWVNQKLYWTDSTDDDIEVYDPATAYRRVLFDNGLYSPYSIVVDPGTGWMYWTDSGPMARIERASMAGTSRAVLHNTNLALPYALTIDYGTQTLYWADYSLDKLESSSADGSNRRLLTTRRFLLQDDRGGV